LRMVCCLPLKVSPYSVKQKSRLYSLLSFKVIKV